MGGALMTDRRWHQKLRDVREVRRVSVPLVMRDDDDGDDGDVTLVGYAATVEEPYDVFGGVEGGGWVETIDRRAFDLTLSSTPDVVLLVNHEGWPLARTKSGTLELSVDGRGLRVRARLDRTDPDVQRLVPKLTRRDMDEMSFAFRVLGQEWSSDFTQRRITEINLQKGDVSVVNYGMNPTTSASLLETVEALSSLSSRELAEIRSQLGLPAQPTIRPAADRTGTDVRGALRELGLADRTPTKMTTTTTATAPAGPTDIADALRGLGHDSDRTTPTASTVCTDRGLVYPESSDGKVSWIKDYIKYSLNLLDGPGVERLERHSRQSKEWSKEWRSISTGLGDGGMAVPPKWLVSDFVMLARPGRAFADLCHKEVLPPSCDSVNMPRFLTGTEAAIQYPENTAIADQDYTDTFVRANKVTVAGAVNISIQALDQSPADLSAIIFKDLAGAHATQIDLQVMTGSGEDGQFLGVDHTPGVVTVGVSSVDIPGFFAAVGYAVQRISGTRSLPPEVIVMHPSRWAWICSAVDLQNRPIVLPHATANNPVLENVASPQVVGELMGCAIVTDPSITTTAGDGNNEDVVYVARSSDLVLWEGPLKLRTIASPRAANMTVILQALNFSAFSAARYPESVIRIRGLTAPEFDIED